MRLKNCNTETITEIPFLNAGPGRQPCYVEHLPVHLAQATGLPTDLDALIVTADLQGREQLPAGSPRHPRLLGETLPARLCEDILPAVGVSPERTGVLLAGDFYTLPNLDERGGSGDVTRVWEAFAGSFKWVAGVAGNHDTFGSAPAPTSPPAGNAHYLDGDAVALDGLRVAGIGGIIGNPRKPHRKTDEQFLEHIRDVFRSPPDILLMHDGPDAPAQRGSRVIRNAVEEYRPTVLVRGHAHWTVPLVQLSNGTQVLNVDCRVVVVRPAD